MGATITVNASTVSAGLLPILHATPWRGHIAAVLQRSLLSALPTGDWCISTRDRNSPHHLVCASRALG